MAEEPKIDYSWPPKEKRAVIGKRVSRLDGPVKSSGRVRYGSDVKRPGMVFGVVLTCPHPHARVTGIDTSAAEKSKGVTAVEVVSPAGTEIQWSGTEIAAVAATSEELARDAVRKIKVEYEVLPHLVHEADLAKAGSRAKPSGEQVTGDPDQAFKEADVVSEGFYGIPVLTHCTLESHGQVIEWKPGELNYWPSTQGVSSVPGELAKMLEIPVTQVHSHQDAVGGGFGSKFSVDRWGGFCAKLSQKSGGRAVKLFLDRATDLEIAGNRPSFFANIKLAGKKDGTITAWQSQSWSTGGVGGASLPPRSLPYVYRKVPNIRTTHTSVSVNAAPQRAWRAPNHPQLSFLTTCAMEDLAARLDMDPLELFTKNADYTEFPEIYKSQFQIGAELAQWKKLWHPRGKSGAGTIKRGLGIGVNTWGGAGHASQCRCNIHADGSVEVELGSQDLGTGTRTIIAMVAAESLGLPVGAIKVNIGDNKYPPSDASGGSTTVGGVSSSTRKATLNAVQRLYEKIAEGLGATPDQLEAVGGTIRVKGNPAKAIAWKAACRKLGTQTISEVGANNPRNPGGLNTGGVAGIQISDVSVDVETGIVRVNRHIAVQDCGMIINPKTAESQCYGAIIMSICGALYEERILDAKTGRMLNNSLDYYKLAGIGDIGEIVVHLDIRPEHDKRGVIGLGEPPVIGGIGAISNAVANAIGVRVPVVPLTPDKVLTALEGRKA